MSSLLTTVEDYKFFDFLVSYRWPGITEETKTLYRGLIKDGDLHIETLLENALAVCSKGQYSRVAGKYMDFSDGSDAKKSISQHRNNHKKKKHWMNSAAIVGCRKKKGLIRALVYSKAQDKFYFFAIPNIAYNGKDRVEVIMDRSTGYQDPVGVPKGKWTVCMVDSFEELSTITHQEAERRWMDHLNSR